jgi:hypothetical protein
MKIKAMLLTVFFLMGLVFMAPQKFTGPKDVSASSLPTFATCEIVWIGTQADVVTKHRIRLTHVPKEGSPVFVDKLFVFSSETAKEMLATALTAMSLGKTVYVEIKDDGLTLNRLWVQN